MKLKREELLAQIDYWGNECRNCAEHHNYSCETGCPHQPRCEQAYQQIREMIQKPEVTEEWIEEKAGELSEMSLYWDVDSKRTWNINKTEAKDFIRSLVEAI